MIKKKMKVGMTLIELVVAIALIGIVITAAFSLFNFSNRIFIKGDQQSTVQNSVRMVAMFISSEVRTAKDVTILETLPIESNMGKFNYVYIDGTDIKHRNVDGEVRIINKGVNGLVPELNFISAASDKLLKFETKFTLNGQSYLVDSEITPLNLVDGDVIQIDSSIEAIGGSVLQYSDPIVDDDAIIRLDTLVLDLNKLNVFLEKQADGSFLLGPPTNRPNFIYLPKIGELGSTISWSAGGSSYIVTSGEKIGTIYRPNTGENNEIVTLTATISKGSGTNLTKSFVVEIAELETLLFNSSSMQLTVPTGTLINHQIIVNGGNPSYNFSSLNVPVGLTLSQNGILQGTVSLANTISISVNDSYLDTSGNISSNSITGDFLLNVTGP